MIVWLDVCSFFPLFFFFFFFFFSFFSFFFSFFFLFFFFEGLHSSQICSLSLYNDVLFQSAVTYEIANDLTYLDMCMNEAMRLFPPGFLSVLLYCFYITTSLTEYFVLQDSCQYFYNMTTGFISVFYHLNTGLI